MYLIGDIGNTDIKICLFNNNLKLVKKVRLKTKLKYLPVAEILDARLQGNDQSDRSSQKT